MFIFYTSLLYILLPLGTAGIYYAQIKSFYPPEFLPSIIFTALPGLFLYFWFMSQFITGSRVKILEKSVGLPTVMRLHIITTYGTVALTIAHGLIYGLGSTNAYIGLMAASIFIALSMVATLLWLDSFLSKIVVIRSLQKIVRKKISYKTFRILHNLNAFAAILVFVHILQSTLVEESPLAKILLTAFFMLSFGSYLYHKLLRPVVLRRRIWELTKVIEENEEITSLEFKKISGPPLKYQAGQFGFFNFISGTLKKQEHPFSFSSAPYENSIRISVKKEQRFTARLRNEAKIGDLAVCDAPYGNFCVPPSTFMKNTKQKFTFIAGGIGVVPFISILEDYIKCYEQQLQQKNTQAQSFYKNIKESISFYWVNSNKEDPFAQKVQHVTQPLVETKIFSRTQNNPLTEDTIRADVNYKNKKYYICASRELTHHILHMLKRLGVKHKNIHYELFSM